MSESVELSTIIEAILFSAGRSMTVEELMEQTGKTRSEISGSLNNLQSTIKRRRDSALQLTEVAGRWIFEVRPTLSTHLPKSVRPDVPARLLPAAALIAYHQPMKQAQLVDMIGAKAYDRVRELANLGFIDRRRDGLTRRLTTTRRFAEYFGCPDVEYRKVREWFRAEAAKAGLTSAQLAASLSEEQMAIEEFTEAPSEEAMAMEATQAEE